MSAFIPPPPGTVLRYGRVVATVEQKGPVVLVPYIPPKPHQTSHSKKEPPFPLAQSPEIASGPLPQADPPSSPSSFSAAAQRHPFVNNDLPLLVPVAGFPSTNWPARVDCATVPEVEVEIADEETTAIILERAKRRRKLATGGPAGTLENPLCGVMRMSSASAFERASVLAEGMKLRASEMVKEYQGAGGLVGDKVLIMMFFHIETLNEEGGVFKKSYTIPSHHRIQVLLNILSIVQNLVFSGIAALTSDLATIISLFESDPEQRAPFCHYQHKRTTAAQNSYLHLSTRFIISQPISSSQTGGEVLLLRTDGHGLLNACLSQIPVVPLTKEMTLAGAAIISSGCFDDAKFERQIAKAAEVHAKAKEKRGELGWKPRTESEESGLFAARAIIESGKGRMATTLVSSQPGVVCRRICIIKQKSPSSTKQNESIDVPNIFVEHGKSSTSWKVDAEQRAADQWDHEEGMKFATNIKFSPSTPESLVHPKQRQVPPAITSSTSLGDLSLDPKSRLARALESLQTAPKDDDTSADASSPSHFKSKATSDGKTEKKKKEKQVLLKEGRYGCVLCGTEFDSILSKGRSSGVGSRINISHLNADGMVIETKGRRTIDLCCDCADKESKIRDASETAARELLRNIIKFVEDPKTEPSPKIANACFKKIRDHYGFWNEARDCSKCDEQGFGCQHELTYHERIFHPEHTRIHLFNRDGSRGPYVRLRVSNEFVCPYKGCSKSFGPDEVPRLKSHWAAHPMPAKKEDAKSLKRKKKNDSDSDDNIPVKKASSKTVSASKKTVPKKKQKRWNVISDSEEDSDSSSPQPAPSKTQKTRKG